MRLDLLLVRLRFVKSRSSAQKWIGAGHFRLNGVRVTQSDTKIAAGMVLTLPTVPDVRIVAVESLPDRRGPPAEARNHYRELDAGPLLAIAGGKCVPQDLQAEGISPP